MKNELLIMIGIILLCLLIKLNIPTEKFQLQGAFIDLATY